MKALLSAEDPGLKGLLLTQDLILARIKTDTGVLSLIWKVKLKAHLPGRVA